MSNTHLNIQAEFFENNPQPQLPSLPPSSDYLQHPIKIHQTTLPNNLSLTSNHQGQTTSSSSSNKFYEEYKRIISVSYNLQIQKERLKAVLGELQSRVLKLQDKLSENGAKPKDTKNNYTVKKQMNSEQNRNKRARRTAEEIQKKYKCDVAFCERYYGSEGSLQQHIKLKHPEIFNKEFEEEEYLPPQNDDLQEHQSL